MKRRVDKKAFGLRVKRRRESFKDPTMSQEELATKIGMKQQGVQNIEAGIVARPRLLKELARALQTTEEWLLWKEGPELAEFANDIDDIAEVWRAISPEQRPLALRLLRQIAQGDKDTAA